MRIRFGIQYNGAGRTGRFSGRGFQIHNMQRAALTVQRPDGTMEKIPVKAKYIDEVVMPGTRPRGWRYATRSRPRSATP